MVADVPAVRAKNRALMTPEQREKLARIESTRPLALIAYQAVCAGVVRPDPARPVFAYDCFPSGPGTALRAFLNLTETQLAVFDAVGRDVFRVQRDTSARLSRLGPLIEFETASDPLDSARLGVERAAGGRIERDRRRAADSAGAKHGGDHPRTGRHPAGQAPNGDRRQGPRRGPETVARSLSGPRDRRASLPRPAAFRVGSRSGQEALRMPNPMAGQPTCSRSRRLRGPDDQSRVSIPDGATACTHLLHHRCRRADRVLPGRIVGAWVCGGYCIRSIRAVLLALDPLVAPVYLRNRDVAATTSQYGAATGPNFTGFRSIRTFRPRRSGRSGLAAFACWAWLDGPALSVSWQPDCASQRLV